eukprot:Nk52_evm124s226 gene=Nk52_evmTU124s226
MTTPFEVWYLQIPVVTRVYATLCILTTAACQLHIVSPFRLYFNWSLIWQSGQYWRLITNFLYFGDLGLDFLLHMFFLVRYSRMLEEGSFRGRTADFLWMLIVACITITVIAYFVNLFFLGLALTFMMVYVWGRRNKHVRMSFLGLFTFTAPYLPWVLLAFALLMGNAPVVDIIGIAVGHVYYFLEDVYPEMTGRRLLEAPAIIKWICGEGQAAAIAIDSDVVQPGQPGGFDWGGGEGEGEDEGLPREGEGEQQRG